MFLYSFGLASKGKKLIDENDNEKDKRIRKNLSLINKNFGKILLIHRLTTKTNYC